MILPRTVFDWACLIFLFTYILLSLICLFFPLFGRFKTYFPIKCINTNKVRFMILSGVIHSVSTFLSNDHIDWLYNQKFDWICSIVNILSQYGIGLNLWVLVLLLNMKSYIHSFRISNSYIVEAIVTNKIKWRIYRFFVTCILRKPTTNSLNQLYLSTLGITNPFENENGIELKESSVGNSETLDRIKENALKKRKIETGKRQSGLEVNHSLIKVTQSIYGNKIKKESRTKVRSFIPEAFYKDEAKNFNILFNTIIVIPSLIILLISGASIVYNASVLTVIDGQTVCMTFDVIKGCIFIWIITEIILLFCVNNMIWEYGNMNEFGEYMPIQYILWNGIIVVCLQACINFGGLLPHPVWRSISTGSIVWLHSFCLWSVIGFKIWKAMINDIDYCTEYSSNHAWINRLPITSLDVTEQERQKFIDFCEIWSKITLNNRESENITTFVNHLRDLYKVQGMNISYSEASQLLDSFKSTIFDSYESSDYLTYSVENEAPIMSKIDNVASLKNMFLDYLDSKYGLAYHTTVSVLGIKEHDNSETRLNRNYSILTNDFY